MFAEKLIYELRFTRNIDEMIGRSIYDDAKEEIKVLDHGYNILMNNFLENVLRLQHFTYNDLEPLCSMLPWKEDHEIVRCLSSIKANLPYPHMTLSYRTIINDITVPHLAYLHELSEGLIQIQLWSQKEVLVMGAENEVGDWFPYAHNIILSTRGDFSTWSGLKDYLTSNGTTESIPYIEDVQGYLFNHNLLFNQQDEPEDESVDSNLQMFQISLVDYIIPYLYLLNAKNIPLKNCNSVASLKSNNKRKYKGIKKIPVQRITYTTINLDFPRLRSHGSGTVLNHSEMKRKMHLCMGHTKEYTTDRPLFGKYVGLVWCPAHVRGSFKNGAVIKNYVSKKRKS